MGGGVEPHCSFCGTEAGPFLKVEGGLPLLMCERCRAARDGTAGPAAPPLLARHDPGQPWYQWGCALCEARVIWPADLEGHTAEAHPGWTARFEIVRPTRGRSCGWCTSKAADPRSRWGRAVTAMRDLARALAAEPWMLGHLDRAYWLWNHVNERSFAGQLSTPLVRIELPHRGVERHAFADIGPTDQAGARLQVRLHPELLRGTIPDYGRTLDSYLLHEMVHAWQVEVLAWPWQPDLDWHDREFQSKLADVERAYALDLTVTRRITWR